MVTGDHGDTAKAIAKRLNILSSTAKLCRESERFQARLDHQCPFCKTSRNMMWCKVVLGSEPGQVVLLSNLEETRSLSRLFTVFALLYIVCSGIGRVPAARRWVRPS